MPGPPNKICQFIDLSGYATPTEKQDALSAAYQQFRTNYGDWPNVAIPIGEVVFLGAYGY